MTSIDRTAYPRFKRTMSAREIVDLFTPSAEEVEWARDKTTAAPNMLALVVWRTQRRGQEPAEPPQVRGISVGFSASTTGTPSSSARGSGPRPPRPGPAEAGCLVYPRTCVRPQIPGLSPGGLGPHLTSSGLPFRLSSGFPSSALRFFPFVRLPLVSLRPASSGSFPSAVTVRFRSPSVSLRVPFPLSNPDASTPAGRFRGRWSRAARTEVTSSGTAPPTVVCARVGLRSCVRPGAGGAGTGRRVCGRRRGR